MKKTTKRHTSHRPGKYKDCEMCMAMLRANKANSRKVIVDIPTLDSLQGECDNCRKKIRGPAGQVLSVYDTLTSLLWLFCSFDCMSKYDQRNGFVEVILIVERAERLKQ